MSEQVFNTISCIIGRRGTRKTTYLRGYKEGGTKGIIHLYPPKNMKVLIVDTLDHPSYRDIPVITVKKLAYWKKGIYRIFVPRDEMPGLNEVLNHTLSNCLLIYEDAFKHTEADLDKPQKELLTDSKQKNIDIIFVYHSWFQVPRGLYRDFLEFIEVFKTKDSPESRKDILQICGYYNEAMELYKQVKESPDPFFHKTLNTDL